MHARRIRQRIRRSTLLLATAALFTDCGHSARHPASHRLADDEHWGTAMLPERTARVAPCERLLKNRFGGTFHLIFFYI